MTFVLRTWALFHSLNFPLKVTVFLLYCLILFLPVSNMHVKKWKETQEPWIHLVLPLRGTMYTFKRTPLSLSCVSLFSSSLYWYKSSHSFKNGWKCTYVANIKSRLWGQWEVSGSINRIDGSKKSYIECRHHIEGLILLMMPCTTCFSPKEWHPYCCGLLHFYLNCYSKQLTGASGPTCQTARRWTTGCYRVEM